MVTVTTVVLQQVLVALAIHLKRHHRRVRMVLHKVPRVVVVPLSPWVMSAEVYDVRQAHIRRLASACEERVEVAPAAKRRRAARHLG